MALSLEYDTAVFPNSIATLRIPMRVQIGAGLILILALLVKVWIRIETTDYGYQLASERQSMIELDRQERALTFALTSLTQPDQLRAAAEPLGLRPTDPSQVWKLANDTH